MSSLKSMKEYRAEFDRYMVPNYAPSEVILVEGKGSHLTDLEGKDYIDFSSGVAVNALGHGHEAYLKTMSEQASKLMHVSNYFTNLPALELAKELTEATFAEQAFFANSGAEANEAALKLARRYAFTKYGVEKDEIISFNQSFHGRTFFTVSVGGQPKYAQDFGPLPGGITHLPLHDKEALKNHISDRTCAVIIEPVQGEGGVISVSDEFLELIYELTRKHKALLIFDEVQTGVGRTGHLYAYQGTKVVPDILTTAKGLGGGFPIGAMLTTKEVASVFTAGVHGSTYGGNPLGCALALTVLKEINKPEVLKGVLKKRAIFEEELLQINKELPFFTEITGKGLLIGLQLKKEFHGKAKMLYTALLKEGVITLVAGLDVLRLAPSLIIGEKDIKEGLARLKKGVASFLV